MKEIAVVISEIRMVTGKSYPLLEEAVKNFSPEVRKDLLRLVRDLDYAVKSAKAKPRWL
jgi:DNA polymerase III delta subunit